MWPWVVTRAVHVGQADATGVGQAPLCIWAERGFGPEALKLIFLFSEYIQILANLRICVGFLSTRKIMKQILLEMF
jgi:hypothetical protein